MATGIWTGAWVVAGSLSLLGGPAEASVGKLLPVPAQRVLAKTSRTVGRGMLVAGVKVKRTLDATDTALVTSGHPQLAGALARLRRVGKPLSPVRLAGFAAGQIKANPMMVPAYLALALPIDATRLALAAHMSPAHGSAMFLATGLPAQLAELFVAHHAMTSYHAGAGNRPSLGKTFRDLAAGYDRYNVRRDEKLARIDAKLP